ncbi:MAG: GntR family transcriptional regulator [Candidatus Eremiobacteraeota bacterium]|nr:GntR family transcriptional regulator [Candidatus Eremiobacteraeota bacterium]
MAAKGLPRYNCSKEVDQPPHWTPTAATRAKWSAQRLGRRHTAEAKAKIGAATLGRRHSLESLQKMRASQRGHRPPDAAWRRSAETTRARFLERVRLAKIWCAQRDIQNCPDGPTLAYQIARCLTNGSLELGDRLPSVGALAEVLNLSVPTVALALRRRAPVSRGLTIIKTGAGLVVARADENQISRPLSFYAMSKGARISATHRARGIGPTQQCLDARRKTAYRRRVAALEKPGAKGNLLLPGFL